jgi:hypothetical protein
MDGLLLARLARISEPFDAASHVEAKLVVEPYSGPVLDECTGEIYLRVPKGTRLYVGDLYAVRLKRL